MRKNFGAKPLLYPQPVFIIAAYDENGILDKAGLKGEVFWIPSHGKTLAMWNPETYNAKFPQDTEESQAIFDSVFYGQGLTGNSNART